jgi:hypothetical protein
MTAELIRRYANRLLPHLVLAAKTLKTPAYGELKKRMGIHVRHAYFTGADNPYDKLKRALKAEIDESAWSALCSTHSYPFEKPSSGKIAVKVINHYGDEVLKVYEV